MRTNVKVIVEGQGLTDGEKVIIQGMVKLLLATVEKQHEVLGQVVNNINEKLSGDDDFARQREVSVPHYSPVYEVQEMLKEAFPNITVRIEPDRPGWGMRGIPVE